MKNVWVYVCYLTIQPILCLGVVAISCDILPFNYLPNCSLFKTDDLRCYQLLPPTQHDLLMRKKITSNKMVQVSGSTAIRTPGLSTVWPNGRRNLWNACGVGWLPRTNNEQAKPEYSTCTGHFPPNVGVAWWDRKWWEWHYLCSVWIIHDIFLHGVNVIPSAILTVADGYPWCSCSHWPIQWSHTWRSYFV